MRSKFAICPSELRESHADLANIRNPTTRLNHESGIVPGRRLLRASQKASIRQSADHHWAHEKTVAEWFQGDVHPLLASLQSPRSLSANFRQSPPRVPSNAAAVFDKQSFNFLKSYLHGDKFTASIEVFGSPGFVKPAM